MIIPSGVAQAEIIGSDLGQLGGHLLPESCHDFGVFGISGEVGVLLGIFFHVEEFEALVAGFPILNEGPIMFAEEEALAVDAEGGIADFVRGVIEDGGDVLALKPLWNVQSTEAGEGRVEI